MPSTASPFGLRPAYHPSGVIRQESGTIASGYATGMYQFSPVKIGTDGTIQQAAAGERAIGSFMGVSYTDSTGRPIVSNQWVASTTYTAGSLVCYYTRDDQIVYEIQSTAAVNQYNLGNQADWANVTAGNSATGLSAATLSSTRTSSASAGLRILGFGKEIDNAAGDTYCNVYVMISEHQDVADEVGYGATSS